MKKLQKLKRGVLRNFGSSFDDQRSLGDHEDGAGKSCSLRDASADLEINRDLKVVRHG